MARLLKIFRRNSYRVSLDKADCGFIYRERGRRMRVAGEPMADGYAVYASSIQHWEATPAELIDDNERQRIAANIRAYLVDRGETVYIS